MRSNSAQATLTLWRTPGITWGFSPRGKANTDEAVRCFSGAVHLSPDHLIALNNLGNAYRLQKKLAGCGQNI